MKRNLIKLFAILLLFQSYSCKDNENGYEKALNFHENHLTEFFNSEFYKFRYHPRTHYHLINEDSISSWFGVIIRGNKELLIINSSGFIKMFDFPIDTFENDYITILSLENSQFIMHIECIGYEDYLHSGDTINKKTTTNIKYTFPIESVTINPVDYFAEIEKQRIKFGIINYSRHDMSKYFNLYFSKHHYLTYIPSDSVLNEEQQKNREERLKSGIKLDDNWYYFKSEEALDVG